MALFEGYERREAKILGVLKEYGINSIEECKDITIAKGVDRNAGGPFDGSKDPDYETYKDVPMRTLPTGALSRAA